MAVNSLALPLIEAGLAARADALTPLALPCVRFNASEAAAIIGGSRTGGLPDVPADFDWPVWRGVPLAFVGQMDLAGASRMVPGVLPEEGVLSFFYEPKQAAWGFDPEDRGAARVYWFPQVAGLRPMEPPQALPRHGRFLPAPLEEWPGVSWPRSSAPVVREIGMSSEEGDAYFEFWEEWDAGEGGRPRHQLLGHPIPVQGEMQLECQLVTAGIYCGGPEGYADPRRGELEPGAREWRLLAQFDSDGDAEMEWGDGGMLYYWIREADLAERRFDRVWAILQCS
ncbi:YwqG family protein [Longimicrobium terrae]|uniref:Uncharacterized protein YwqG n=1 Tax=Longimicrobium terrae TaxID=1639882 RepID=A0A841GTM6_9BACT|nr:YwqG family protein [Longimicrobium terrae]MBB4634622.1 uncharacterized protein YwqG [Longimicrobium terrae]MBB6068488.1 uncharacterized protein YwqG [Longimicrobium terrae]NNC27678.1 DUF1963 domain-containing protein [Longimicrobium terrae]